MGLYRLQMGKRRNLKRPGLGVALSKGEACLTHPTPNPGLLEALPYREEEP